MFCAVGALAGNPFGVDRQQIASDLGFVGGVCPNSMDAVSDRDFVLETLFFAATTAVHLSRWAEDLIIYSSGQFKFVQCSDAYATGQRLHQIPTSPNELHVYELLSQSTVFVSCREQPDASEKES